MLLGAAYLGICYYTGQEFKHRTELILKSPMLSSFTKGKTEWKTGLLTSSVNIKLPFGSPNTEVTLRIKARHFPKFGKNRRISALRLQGGLEFSPSLKKDLIRSIDPIPKINLAGTVNSDRTGHVYLLFNSIKSLLKPNYNLQLSKGARFKILMDKYPRGFLTRIPNFKLAEAKGPKKFSIKNATALFEVHNKSDQSHLKFETTAQNSHFNWGNGKEDHASFKRGVIHIDVKNIPIKQIQILAANSKNPNDFWAQIMKANQIKFILGANFDMPGGKFLSNINLRLVEFPKNHSPTDYVKKLTGVGDFKVSKKTVMALAPDLVVPLELLTKRQLISLKNGIYRTQIKLNKGMIMINNKEIPIEAFKGNLF